MKKHILKLYSNKYTMKKYEKLLRNLGMNDYEIAIYLSLIEHGPMHISAISESIWHHRPLVYKITQSLESEGYISKTMSIWGKRTLYQVTSPKILALRAADIQKQTAIIIPELEAIYEKSLDRPKLTIKEWIDWIRSIHSDLIHSLPKWGISYRYSSSNREFEERTLYVPDDYFDIQKRKELERYTITNEERRKYREWNPYREVVCIPKWVDPFDDNISKIIYENKVAIIDYNTQVGWIIESERFARYEEKIFKLLFKTLKMKI